MNFSALNYIDEWDFQEDNTFLGSKWTPLIMTVAYIFTIQLLTSYMKDHKPFSGLFITGPIVLHNALLVTFSFVVCIGTFHTILSNSTSLHDAICDPTLKFASGRFQYIVYIFYLSKYYEFLDTVFLVLKKREVIFLHFYHHIVTATVAYIGVYIHVSGQWVLISLNSFVHVWMYSYYAAAALGYSAWWKKYLTTLQIAQFCINFPAVLYLTYANYTTPGGCSVDIKGLILVAVFNLSLLYLFLDFYRKSYTKEKKK